MNRIVWVDYAKTIAIYAVLVIHTHCDVATTKICNAVALPLFFFVSGYLFSFERHGEFMPFLRKRFRQLIVPYIWINIVAYIFWLTVGRHYGDDAASGLAWHEPLVGMALGIGPKLAHDIPLWSLISFFVVEMAYYLAYRLIPRNGIWLALFLFSAYLMGEFREYTSALPLTAGPVMAGLFFYTAGRIVRSEKRLDSFVGRFSPVLTPVLLAVFVCLCEINQEVNFYICRYGDFILFVSGALAGVVGIVMLCSGLGKWLGRNRAIDWISVGTLLICGFHLMVYTLMKGAGYFIFGVSPAEMTAGAARGLLFAFAGLLLCIPIVMFVEKYLRVLTDK